MPIPGVPITQVPNEGDTDYPSLEAIKTIDSVGPSAANRQPNQLRTRDQTLRDRVNKLVDSITFIGTSEAGSTDYYLPRDASLPMLGDLDMDNFRINDIKRITMQSSGGGGEGAFMGSNRIQDVADPTAAQDAATKAYVDSQVGGASLNTVRPVVTPCYVEVADASPGGVQSSNIDVDFDKLIETPSDLPPPYMSFMLGMSSTNTLGGAFACLWHVEVWSLYNLSGPNLLRYRTRITLLEGTPGPTPTGAFARQDTSVYAAIGPYWGLTSGITLASGTQLTVAAFTGSIDLRLTWSLDTPSVSFNRLNVRLQSDATGVYADGALVHQMLADL